MAVRKLKPQTDEQLRIADRAARARKAQPPRDPTGDHHATCCEIAREAGIEPFFVLDAWDERAAIRQYDGNADRADAERLAVDDVRAIFIRQKGLDL